MCFNVRKCNADTKYNRVLQDESLFHITFVTNFFSKVTFWNPELCQNQRTTLSYTSEEILMMVSSRLVIANMIK